MRDVIGFFILIAGVLFSLLLVWFGLRQYGLNRPISPFQTPLIEELIQQTQPITWSTLQPHSWPILKIDFQNNQWESESGLDLPTALQQTGSHPLLLFFQGRDSKALPKLREEMNKVEKWKNTIFCSQQDGLLKDLRELEPKWTYCSGEAYLVRLLAFSSLGLESLLQIPSDVVFVHLTSKLSATDIDRIIQEGKRQKKLVIVGPVPRPLVGLSPHGWMVENKDPKVQ